MNPHRKKIGIDVRMWGHPGIGRYLKELVFAMSRAVPPEKRSDFIFLCYGADQSEIKKHFPEATCRRAFSGIYSFLEQIELFVFSFKAELLHVPHFNAPFFCVSKLVVTIHDLIYLKKRFFRAKSFRGWFFGALRALYTRLLFLNIEKNAARVIAVSKSTKKDLCDFFPRLKDRTEVVYEAASSCFRGSVRPEELARAPEKLSLERPFILFVGSIKDHKNLPALLSAFKKIKIERGLSHKLLIVGKKDPKEPGLIRMIEEMDSVRIIEGLSDSELALIYHLAEVLVIPSFQEGFGLPVLEAMSCGTPVLCANASSLPEVAGEAARLFDPFNADELSRELLTVLSSKEIRSDMSAAGLARAALFSWESTAVKTLGVYARVLA